MKAEPLTTEELKCPEERRTLARSSSSATISGNPEGSGSVICELSDAAEDTRRNCIAVETRHAVATIRTVNPGE